MIVGLVVGVVAALGPAHQASRIDILDAPPPNQAWIEHGDNVDH